VCVLSTASRAEAEAGAEAGAAGREAWEGSAARRFREGPLEQLRIELQPYLSAAATLCIFCCHR